MPATKTNLRVEKGADWSHGWAVTVNGTPIDETWAARSQVRKTASSATILHTFDAEVDSEGVVKIAVGPDESAAWVWTSGVYDVEIVNADESVTLRVAEGTITVSLEVTR